MRVLYLGLVVYVENQTTKTDNHLLREEYLNKETAESIMRNFSEYIQIRVAVIFEGENIEIRGLHIVSIDEKIFYKNISPFEEFFKVAQ